jgi:flagellar motor switch protein FliM
MSEQENLLTSEEMNALLPETDGQQGSERDRKNRVTPYNFRRPDRLSKEQLRALYLLHDLFGQSLSSALPLQLQAIVEVNLISVDQNPYSEYVKGLQDPTTMFTVAVEPLGGVFAIDMSSTIAFPVIDRLLGGSGSESSDPSKSATDLELKILEGFMGAVIENYATAWKPIAEIKTAFAGRETRPQMLQITAPNEIVIVVAYQVQIGDARGTMSFCLPVVLLEPVIDKFNQSSYSTSTAPNPAATLSLLKTLSAVRMPVTAELVKTPAAISDLASLAIGDVLRTNHRTDKPVNVKVNGLSKFAGSVASFDGRMVIQVTNKIDQNLSKNS